MAQLLHSVGVHKQSVIQGSGKSLVGWDVKALLAQHIPYDNGTRAVIAPHLPQLGKGVRVLDHVVVDYRDGLLV